MGPAKILELPKLFRIAESAHRTDESHTEHRGASLLRGLWQWLTHLSSWCWVQVSAVRSCRWFCDGSATPSFCWKAANIRALPLVNHRLRLRISSSRHSPPNMTSPCSANFRNGDRGRKLIRKSPAG